MSVTEEILAKHDGNKVAAATELASRLMEGEAATYKQGYSIGNALISAIDIYNLTTYEVALVADRLVTQPRPQRMKLQIHDSEMDHFVMRSDGPMRVEVSLLPDASRDGDGPVWDRVIAHAYSGYESVPDQEPDLTYDGSEADDMESQDRVT